MLRGMILVVGVAFGSTGYGAEDLSPEQICERFKLDADVFVYDQSGEKLLRRMRESRSYRVGGAFTQAIGDDKQVCKISGQWGSVTSAFERPLYIQHQWQVLDDGRITGSVEQFAKEENVGKGARFKDSLGKREFEVKYMAPVIWESRLHKDEKVVVRFTPTLVAESSPKDIAQIPIAGEDLVITDANGFVWANDLYLDGIFVGITSHKGTLRFSFYPFAGGEKVGVARGKDMELSLEGAGLVRIKSRTSFLPAGVAANVYASYQSSPKSSGLNSQHVFTSSDRAKFEAK